jgi:hypothetical protein
MADVKSFCSIPDIVYINRKRKKEMKYTYDKAYGVLSGIRDCFRIAYENNYTRMYRETLSKLLLDHFQYYYEYAYAKDDQVLGLIEEILSIEQKWIGESYSTISKDSITDIVEYGLSFKQKCECFVEYGKSIIIYGAGYGAKELYDAFFKGYSHFVGVAVTDVNDSNSECIDGFRPCDIRDYLKYKNDAEIIISLKDQGKQRLINSYLKDLGFVNVTVISMDISWVTRI